MSIQPQIFLFIPYIVRSIFSTGGIPNGTIMCSMPDRALRSKFHSIETMCRNMGLVKMKRREKTIEL